MKSVFSSFVIAFSMYSKIPMPRVEWTPENRRYVMCFFPLVGFAAGALEYGWFVAAAHLPVNHILRAAVAVLLPLLVSGGIHFDGFLDVCDAMSSWRERDERLRILKDPHVGSFAVIGGIVYFLLAFAFVCSVPLKAVPVMCFVFMYSRTISAISVITLPKASPKGTAAAFADSVGKKAILAVLMIYLTALTVLMVLFQPFCAALILAGIVAAVLYYLHLVRRYFGGMTGDLAGHFVCICELLALAGAVAAGIIGIR